MLTLTWVKGIWSSPPEHINTRTEQLNNKQ
jgi:hypothetical protein